MMKHTGRLLFLLLLAGALLLLAACGGETETKTYTVSVESGDHYTLNSTSARVEEGASAVFHVTVETGYQITGVSEGAVYDAAAGTITVPDVRRNMRVTVTVEELQIATVTLKPGSDYTADVYEAVATDGTAVFHLTAAEDRWIAGCTADTDAVCTYDEETGTLTVSGVTADTTVTVSTGSNAKIYFSVTDGLSDTASTLWPEGTRITVRADSSKGYFLGWSFDKRASAGGTIVSEDEEFTFYLSETQNRIFGNYTQTPPGTEFTFAVIGGESSVPAGKYPSGTQITVTIDTTKGTFDGWSVNYAKAAGGKLVSRNASYTFTLNENMILYPNFKTGTITYHLNGGTAEGGETTYAQNVDTSFFTCPNSLINLGGFVREGYVLVEYNTKADGTGVGYSVGSKITLDGMSNSAELYCIWAEAAPASEFTYEDVFFTIGGKKDVEGVAITGYTGSGDWLVIPETIDGKAVVQISAGAVKNKNFETLVLPRTLIRVEDGAFTGCSSLVTLYMYDSIYSISDAAFDEATATNWEHFYLSAALKPRYASSNEGTFRVKWDRLMEESGRDKLIVVAGSSAFQGLGTAYLEALLDYQYDVVNYGNTRTTNNAVYMEMISHFVGEGDIVIYSPENSAYQFGYTGLTWKLFRDLEGCLNAWRYIDIGNYTKYFDEFTVYQQSRYFMGEQNFEKNKSSGVDFNGDNQNANRKQLASNYIDSYAITLNEYIKSELEGNWQDEDKDWSGGSPTWSTIDQYAAYMAAKIKDVEATGAAVYFSFCPADEFALIDEAKSEAWQKAYDAYIAETLDVTVLGTCSDYIWAHKYFYDCAFHVNDIGRPLRTYQLYKDLAQELGLSVKAMDAVGTDYDGCIFE